MRFLGSKEVRQMRKDIDDIREVSAKGYSIYLLKETEADCPDCGYDPITQESTDITCETCGGLGVIITTVKLPITAGVIKHDNDNIQHNSGVEVGSKLTLDISIVDYNLYSSFIDTMEKIEVDGVNYRPIDRSLRGISSPNRLIMEVEKITG